MLSRTLTSVLAANWLCELFQRRPRALFVWGLDRAFRKTASKGGSLSQHLRITKTMERPEEKKVIEERKTIRG